MKNFKVLSIDAWGNKKDGYEWNNWFTIGCINETKLNLFDKNKKEFLNELLKIGLINRSDLRITEFEDDQYNIILIDRKSKRPIIAIEYGREY